MVFFKYFLCTVLLVLSVYPVNEHTIDNLFMALQLGDLDCIKSLRLQEGLLPVNINIHRDNVSPLTSAILKSSQDPENYIPIIFYLLTRLKADPNFRDVNGDSPLFVALRAHAPVEVIQLLLDHGADILALCNINYSRQSVLSVAAIQSSLPVFEVLLEQVLIQRNESNNDEINRILNTALEQAVSGMRDDRINLLLDAGAHADRDSVIVLYTMAAGNPKFLIELLRRGANPNAHHRVFIADMNPLLNALSQQNNNYVRILSMFGADTRQICTSDTFFPNELIRAVVCHQPVNIEMIQNASQGQRNAALYYAMGQLRVDVVRQLLFHGAVFARSTPENITVHDILLNRIVNHKTLSKRELESLAEIIALYFFSLHMHKTILDDDVLLQTMRHIFPLPPFLERRVLSLYLNFVHGSPQPLSDTEQTAKKVKVDPCVELHEAIEKSDVKKLKELLAHSPDLLSGLGQELLNHAQFVYETLVTEAASEDFINAAHEIIRLVQEYMNKSLFQGLSLFPIKDTSNLG